MDSLKDLLTSIKRSTLDQTDLDEKLMSGIGNVRRNFTQARIKSPVPQRQQIKPQDNFISQLGRSRVGQGITNFQRGIENRTLPKVNLTDPTKSNYFSLGSVRLPNTVQSPIPMPVLNTGFQALGKVQNTQAPVPRFGAELGLGMAQELINTPQRLLEGGGRIGVDIVRPLQQGKQINPWKATGAVAHTALPLLDLATLGGGTIVRGLGKQALQKGGQQTLKQVIKSGAKQGAGYGAVFGGLSGAAEGDQTTAGNTLMGLGGGIALGGLLGGGAAGIGGLIAMIRHTPQVEKQLRDQMGRYTKGQTPVKPKGMPKAQWDFQLNFNRKYNRNPYTPVFHDDLNRALDYELNKRGAGLSIRDVNKDKNPLGGKVANAGLGDVKPNIVYRGTEDMTEGMPRPSTRGDLGAGIYFARDRKIAEKFTDSSFRSSVLEPRGDGSFININTGEITRPKNPGVREIDISKLKIKKIEPGEYRAEIEKLRQPNGVLPPDYDTLAQRKFKEEGYDGIEITGTPRGENDQILVFTESANKMVDPPAAQPSTPNAGLSDTETYYRGVKDTSKALVPSVDKNASYGKGVYLTTDQAVAKDYGSKVATVRTNQKLNLYTPTENERLEIVSLFGKEQDSYIKKLLGNNYDGLKIVKPSYYGDATPEIVVYNPTKLSISEAPVNAKTREAATRGDSSPLKKSGNATGVSRVAQPSLNDIGTSDKHDIQELRNAVQEGRNILRTGSIDGRKLSQDELLAVSRSVENAQARIGAEIKDGATIQELSYDQLTNRANGVSSNDVSKEGLKKWKLLVSRGEATFEDGIFRRVDKAQQLPKSTFQQTADRIPPAQGAIDNPIISRVPQNKQFNLASKLDDAEYKVFNDAWKREQRSLMIDEDLMEDLPRNITGKQAFERMNNTGIMGEHDAIADDVVENLRKLGYTDSAPKPVNISSEGTKMKSGKIKVRNFPTQTEVKNRAELNAGNPDLYTQRGQKLDEMFGNSEPLPWETNIQDKKSRVKLQGQLSQSGKQGRVDDLQGGSQSKLPSQGVQQRLPTKQSLDDIVERSDINVKDKVNIIDYFRTPDRVFKKVGLEKEVKLLRQKEDDYLQELPKNIDKITEWSERVSPESNKRIFQYLDGQGVKLQGEEQKVAKEIQTWLKGWADRLGLPEDKRITNYITHIFEKDFIQKEFDPEIAKIIRDRVPGSVYDPFVEQRLGKAGYVEDTWRALDAYVKRATRKVHMDEALEEIARKADNLEDSQFNYIKGRLDRINMRPTWIDNMIDNTVKSAIGYKFGQRPVASLSKGARQMVYRATLGLNPGTALKNLTQGANTYAKLGEKYTFKGYSKLVKNFNSSELEDVGILKKDMIQDRSYHATRKFWEKVDKGLFAFFELAEKINRGAAYYGAKAKALDSGATEKEAIEAGKKMVRDTQFTFGAVDTPAVLQSDIGKTLGQFQSFTLKQGEFLTEMAKNKEYLGLLRWVGASLGMVYTVGELIGMEPADLIPSVRIGTPPTLQLPAEVAGAIANTPDKYGNDRDLGDKLGDIGNSALLFAPGSTQFKKTFEGIRDVSRGYSTNDYGIKGIINTVRGKEGKVRFPVEQTPTNFIRGALFGTNNLPEANEYYDNERRPLGENQSSLFKGATDKVGLYAKLIGNRESGREIDEAKEQVKSEGGAQTVGETIIYFDEDSGEARTLDLSKFSKEQSGIAKYEMQKEKYETARKAYGASGLTDEQKQQVYKATGITGEDAEYDYIATKESAIKAGFLNESLASEDHDAVIEALTAFRKPSVSGQIVANDKTLDLLADEGLITSAEAKALKRIDYDSKGNLKASGSKGSKKAPPAFKLVSSQTQLSAPFSGGGSDFTVKTPSMTSSSIGSTKVPRLRLTPGKSSEDARKLRLAIQNSNLSAPRLTFTRK